MVCVICLDVFLFSLSSVIFVVLFSLIEFHPLITKIYELSKTQRMNLKKNSSKNLLTKTKTFFL